MNKHYVWYIEQKREHSIKTKQNTDSKKNAEKMWKRDEKTPN